MKRTTLLSLLLCIGGTALAQHNLPPAWNDNPEKAQQYDERTWVYLSPERIMWTQNGDLISDPEHLLLPGNGQAELADSKVSRFKSTEGRRPSILLDFGRELQGGIQIVTGGGAGPVKLRVRFGESASEAMSDVGPQSGATNDHAMRDFTMQIPWLGVAESGNSGFRFVRIDLLDDDVTVDIKEIRAKFGFRDIPYLGSFKCDDERLNKIWMTGAYTVHLNMQDYLWDGIKRDRLVWIGDIHPEVMTVNSVFGFNEVVPKSLDLIRDITPLPGWMNGISSYSLWWIITHRDWYYYQGDREYLAEQKEYMSALLRHLMTKVGDNGKEQLDGMRFLDWPSSPNQKGVDAGLQALMAITMDAGSEMMRVLGDQALSDECAQKAALLRKYVPAHNDSKQGAALMAISGLADPVQMNEEVISVGGSRNFSTFYGYYMLRAMALAGDYTGALDRIREYWGAMLDLGATTFWEDFNMEWIPGAAPIDELVPAGMKDIHGDFGDYCYQRFRHSLCHGWASGPTSWLSEFVLGVRVTKPGCREVRITPNLGNLEWAEGTFPTPHGVIEIRHHKRADGSVESEIKAPKGVKIIRSTK